ncbi:MAG: protein-export membrane protein SecF [Candidatus Taylorbacteria bacterium RIFCSPHIGHO2_01_FULL_46_22b]|uniref:Protein-export membrane protein SecF n=1 Tax=Candidatus Taylorbacteria bacterium RIFCSPHIGHO2_01_FULL_46_22b TaxID=1802301 RepID=A0A1G2M492_9BACT|nr:MAG: protein-export membrane protein SecF [Candidatus Taylorbacteria bacterium RIFCSPHIGHO2_01_FULL_46_22b]
MFIVQHRKWFYAVSIILVILSVAAMFVWGFNLGIDFKGGSLLEVTYTTERPALSDVQEAVATVIGGEPSVRSIGDAGYIIRMRSLTEPERQQIIAALSADKQQFTEDRFDSIGPLLGAESARKSLISIVLVLVMIILFIAFAFRKVSEPVSSWKYGLIAVIALAHDVIIPTGVFVLLGYFNPTIEIDSLFVTAILVILGFSVHDTIVVFDRVRENLRLSRKEPFDQIVGKSISQTFTRSINTSLTVVFSLIVLYFVGGVATHNFTLALLIGIVAGTYSSIFLGSPLLVTVEKWQHRKQK